MSTTAVTALPGVGKTFAKDFVRTGMHRVEDFQGKQADAIFKTLAIANQQDNHKTSKNYLYVICMIMNDAGGGQDAENLKWRFWKG